MAVTLKEIAKKTGYSEATVSLALNNSNLVNIKTKNKIKKVADNLEYVADIRGQSLARKTSKTIALIIGTMDNPFNAEISQYIKNEIKKSGYNLIICTTRGKKEEEFNYLKLLKSGAVDGAIFTTRYKNAFDIDQKILELKNDIGIVYIDRENEAGKNKLTTVLSDRENDFKNLIEKLIFLGYKKIGYVGNIETLRFEGYKKALTKNGLSLKQDYIYNTGWNDGYQIGTEAAKKVIKNGNFPEVFCCFNDQVAIGFMQSLIKQGYSVPEDLAVSGFDNIEISEYFSPSLTTAAIEKEKIAKKAVAELISIIREKDNQDYQPKKLIYPSKIILRDSTKRVN